MVPFHSYGRSGPRTVDGFPKRDCKEGLKAGFEHRNMIGSGVEREREREREKEEFNGPPSCILCWGTSQSQSQSLKMRTCIWTDLVASQLHQYRDFKTHGSTPSIEYISCQTVSDMPNVSDEYSFQPPSHLQSSIERDWASKISRSHAYWSFGA